ncbi:MAG TPA: TadE/TadG family type IV pilus assembly protein [Candidatus Acidoferrales bacterium]|nr:TadE/TadG family type IV pilus assembly protein [Candidatus Acidoferrales bacterium]
MIRILRAARNDRATTTLEFALVAPALILVLICCLDFARALDAYVLATNATRDGARYATMQAVDPSAVPSIKAYVIQRAAPLALSSADVHVSFGTPEPSWAPSAPQPLTVTVTIDYSWQAVTWVAGTFISATGTRTFHATSTMEGMQ